MYHIRHVPPHTYAAVEFGGGGYEPTHILNVKVKHDVTLDNSVYRDWAALSGGAVLKSFTPPDYAIFCGVNADGAFDLGRDLRGRQRCRRDRLQVHDEDGRRHVEAGSAGHGHRKRPARAYAPTGNADNVVAIRFVMLQPNGNPQFMDVLEAGVRGGAA